MMRKRRAINTQRGAMVGELRVVTVENGPPHAV